MNISKPIKCSIYFYLPGMKSFILPPKNFLFANTQKGAEVQAEENSSKTQKYLECILKQLKNHP